MNRKSNALLAGLFVLALVVSLRAAENRPVEGALLVGKRSHNLTHAVAFEWNTGDDSAKDDEDEDDDDDQSDAVKAGDKRDTPQVALLASDRTIPVDQIKSALKEGAEFNKRLLTQPHVLIVVNEEGEFEHCSIYSEGTSSQSGGSRLTGKLKVENGRLRGKVSLPPQGDGDLRRSFELSVDLAMGLDAARPARPAGPVKPTVSGTFKGNGKDAKLAFVSARPGEPFNDKPSIVLVFTEKDHLKENRPDIKAGFGQFGSALILSVHEDGSVFGCEVAHAAHEKKPFSSVGRIRTGAFEAGDGQVSGEVTTDGEVETFDQTWQIAIKFAAPYAAAKVATAEKPKARKPANDDEPDDDDDPPAKEKPSKPAASAKARALPIPKDATSVNFKELVEQITFKSPASVQALSTDLTKKLAEQGWKGDGADLVTPKSAILKRKRGEASLTIMLKPADKGSQATIFTEGLDWSKE